MSFIGICTRGLWGGVRVGDGTGDIIYYTDPFEIISLEDDDYEIIDLQDEESFDIISLSEEEYETIIIEEGL